MNSFKSWLLERLTEPPVAPDPSRRPDLIKGGFGGCEFQPLGVRTMCQPTTSAFPTYSKKTFKKHFKRHV